VRNIFLFIRRYFNFLFFLVLQIMALSFLFRYNKFHEAIAMGVMGEFTGKVNEKYNNVEYFFHLKSTNDSLAKENLRLRQLLKENFEWPDSLKKLVVDTLKIDSLRKIQKYIYLGAKVVANTVSLQTNFLTIHRGAAQGVKTNTGVVGPQGIVGRVVNVSENYATVMSMLNRQFKVVVKLKNGGEMGTVEWDGITPAFVTLKDIPKSARINKGDTVLTSQITSLFPANIMVGTIQEVVEDKASNFYVLKLKPATNFFNIEYVYVTENTQYAEQKQLEDSTRKKIQ
jgi:rod shape-determining protein MreC